MKTHNHSGVLAQINKAKGQLLRVEKMATDGRYCMDIIQQINALLGILKQANNAMLERHLHTCGAKLASKDPKARERFIAEIMRACDISQRRR